MTLFLLQAKHEPPAGSKQRSKLNYTTVALLRLYWPALLLHSFWVLVEIGIRCAHASNPCRRHDVDVSCAPVTLVKDTGSVQVVHFHLGRVWCAYGKFNESKTASRAAGCALQAELTSHPASVPDLAAACSCGPSWQPCLAGLAVGPWSSSRRCLHDTGTSPVLLVRRGAATMNHAPLCWQCGSIPETPGPHHAHNLSHCKNSCVILSAVIALTPSKVVSQSNGCRRAVADVAELLLAQHSVSRVL